MANIISITQHNFEQEIVHSSKPVVIDVYATWCGPCQHMEPVFEELANTYGTSYTFAKLNVDEARDIAVLYNVSSVPTFLFIKDGKLIAQEIGFMNKSELEARIKSHFS